MNVFGVGLPEMAVIGAVALLVFGPKRLPELGKTLGKTVPTRKRAKFSLTAPAQTACGICVMGVRPGISKYAPGAR